MNEQNRFTDRTMTIQEAIWLDNGGKGSLEELVLWMESRLNEENRNLHLRSMPETMLPILIGECLEGCSLASQ